MAIQQKNVARMMEKGNQFMLVREYLVRNSGGFDEI